MQAVYTDKCNSTERENDHSGRESTMKALLGTESCKGLHQVYGSNR